MSKSISGTLRAKAGLYRRGSSLYYRSDGSWRDRASGKVVLASPNASANQLNTLLKRPSKEREPTLKNIYGRDRLVAKRRPQIARAEMIRLAHVRQGKFRL